MTAVHPLGPAAGISPAAHRAAEAMNEALRAGMVGGWLAISLRDGSTDGRCYELRADAVRHQLHETQCMYLCVPPMMTPPADMETLLDRHRAMYDAGFSMVDPSQRSAAR